MITYEECIAHSFYGVMMEMQGRYARQTAFAWMENGGIKSVTYRQMIRDVRRLAFVFSENHLEGQRIVIEGENGYQQIVSLFSAIMAGACAAVLSFDVPEDELRDTLLRIHPSAFVCQKESFPEITEYAEKQESTLFTTEEIFSALNENGKLYEEECCPDKERDALILQTSGSSGKSKLVVLPQRAFWIHHDIDEGDQLLVNPLHHIAALYAICGNLRSGSRMCLSDMRNGIRDILWFRPQMMITVPMYLDFLIKKAQKKGLDLSSFKLFIRVGAPGNQNTDESLENMGIAVRSLYGMTETAGAVTSITDGQYKKESEGKIGRWNEGRISGQGEILVKGCNVMSRYLDDEESTSQIFTDGWLHTGDTGYIDEDGFLFLTGRMKNVIILSNGENVSPEAIERTLDQCRRIKEAVVRGEDDLLAAYIYCGLNPDEETKKEAEEFVREYNKSVPSYRRVRRIVFTDNPFERTSSGKIKRQIRECSYDNV